jgi:hypothetical protein
VIRSILQRADDDARRRVARARSWSLMRVAEQPDHRDFLGHLEDWQPLPEGGFGIRAQSQLPSLTRKEREALQIRYLKLVRRVGGLDRLAELMRSAAKRALAQE